MISTDYSMPTDIVLRQRLLAPVPEATARLLAGAGFTVVHYPNKRSKRYWLVSWAAALVKHLPRLRRAGETDQKCLERIHKAGLGAVIGAVVAGEFVDPCDARPPLARVLGKPVVIGPLRLHPDDAYDLQDDDGVWHRATDELVAALDAQARLGAPRTRLQFAAEILAEARQEMQKNGQGKKTAQSKRRRRQ